MGSLCLVSFCLYRSLCFFKCTIKRKHTVVGCEHLGLHGVDLVFRGNRKMKEKTYEEIARDKISTVYHDKWEDGMRFVILRGPNSLCAYIGISKDHLLAGFSYDGFPVEAHGGLTYARDSLEGIKNDMEWWYGWDYGHCNDFVFYHLEDNYKEFADDNDTKWTVEMVRDDSWSTLHSMKNLAKLIQEIRDKVKNEDR